MRKFKQTILMAVLGSVVGAITLTACSWFQPKDGERSAGRVVDDDHITSQVKSELKKEPIFKLGDVDVKTFDGIVQLSGWVNTEEQKQRAGKIAQDTPGVGQVVNNITLKPQTVPAPTGKAAGTAAPTPAQTQPAQK